MECSIETSDGVKVADIAWASEHFIEQYGYATPYQVAPEICVEILNPSDTQAEMDEKIQLYLAKGAKEVWICDENGELSYFSYIGQIKQSYEISKK